MDCVAYIYTRMSYVALAVIHLHEYFIKGLPLSPALPDNMHSDRLSRQDTLPAEDPVWSYPQVAPGLPAPIPPRNEPLLYISEKIVDSGIPALQVSMIIFEMIYHVLIPA